MVKPTGLAGGVGVDYEGNTRCLVLATGSLWWSGWSTMENWKTMGRAGLMSLWQVESVGIMDSVWSEMPIGHRNGDVQKAQLEGWLRNHEWSPGCTCKFGVISKYMTFKTIKLDEITAIIITVFRLVQDPFISYLYFCINHVTISLFPMPFYYPSSALLWEWFKKCTYHQIRSLLCLMPSGRCLSHCIS